MDRFVVGGLGSAGLQVKGVHLVLMVLLQNISTLPCIPSLRHLSFGSQLVQLGMVIWTTNVGRSEPVVQLRLFRE